MRKIFISYRRDGGEFLAGRIFDYFNTLGIAAFYDVESINTGKFDEQLYNQISECDFFMLVLTKGALDRCNNANDWVRLEIAKAIELKKNIIPVIAPGFEFPDNLPDDINEIIYYQATPISSNLFKLQMDKLIESAGLMRKPKKIKIIIFTFILTLLALSAVIYTALYNTKPADNVSAPKTTNHKFTEKEIPQTFHFKASSELQPTEGNNYYVQNAFDNNIYTAWIENSTDEGIGENISVSFERPVTISKTDILNGYVKSENIYYKNNRAKSITATFITSNSVFDKKFEFDDVFKGNFRHIFDPPLTNVTEIIFTLSDGVYKGTAYNDTAITDIIFYDENGNIIDLSNKQQSKPPVKPVACTNP